MQIDDMVLVSIDDHVVEPPDMFQQHVPMRYADAAPHIVEQDGIERWVFQDIVVGSMGLNAVVSWPKEEWGMDPTTFAEMRPGAYDVHERIRDMNRNGVLASMCFPTFAGFSARTFQEAKDKDLALTMLRAYNDWHIDEWAGTYDVYLNLPQNEKPDVHSAFYAGPLPMFGLEEASRTDGKHEAQGLYKHLEVTDLYNRLAGMPGWDPTRLRITFAARTPGSGGKIQVGRVSLSMASR